LSIIAAATAIQIKAREREERMNPKSPHDFSRTDKVSKDCITTWKSLDCFLTTHFMSKKSGSPVKLDCFLPVLGAF
jgi:hypothetical protein